MVQKVCLELKLLSCCSGEINFIFCARLPKYVKFQSKRQNWGLILNFKQRRCRRRQTILWGFKSLTQKAKRQRKMLWTFYWTLYTKFGVTKDNLTSFSKNILENNISLLLCNCGNTQKMVAGESYTLNYLLIRALKNRSGMGSHVCLAKLIDNKVIIWFYMKMG